MRHLLEEQGLTPHEVTVYEALLSHGALLAGEITRITGIHRRNVYDCLERLVHKGLAGYILENNRKRFSLTDPGLILERLREQEREWEKILPELRARQQKGREQTTLFFRGKQGIRLVLEDQIAQGKEILVNATSVGVSEILRYFFPKYHLLRKERGIGTRMLFDAGYKSKENLAKLRELPLAKVRFLAQFNTSPMSQYVYGENVAILVWGEQPVAILIRQEEIAAGFKASFELLWKMAE